MQNAHRLTGLARGLRIVLFVVMLVVTFTVMAGVGQADPVATEVAYATPMAVPPAVALGSSAIPVDVDRRPTGPSSLALLAMGLGLLFVVRPRRWVR